MSSVDSFATFLQGFFDIFAGKSFYGGDYLAYLQRSVDLRRGDEAATVDMAIVSPLLDLLGFEPAERVYNRQKSDGRPDFAPRDALHGTCFMVEDKSTSLALNFDLGNPQSHLSQLIGYMRSAAVHLGLLTNGIQLTAWRLEASGQPVQIIDLDLPGAIAEWRRSGSSLFPQKLERSLQDLFDLYRKESFTDPQRLEKEIAMDLDEWTIRALPLDTESIYQSALVDALQSLIKDLQMDARRMLQHHLERYVEYTEKASRFTDDDPEPATRQFKRLRDRLVSILNTSFQKVWNLQDEDILAIQEVLVNLEQDTRIFASPREILQKILAIINMARQRKTPLKSSLVDESFLEEFRTFNDPLKIYIERGFAWHRRQAELRHDYREDLQVYDDYTTWKALVQETMLGDLDEELRRDEFALQGAYVVFIRLLLIRVCEDKGVFPHRFLSDGGLKHWQEDIERYFIFARGNPYSPLLNMAYENAQNIYAHFFTGRELFNWYKLDKKRFILTLYQLGRFNFAHVDADIIGTIYNTYVNREEKRNKGQYYTPPEIVHYILDNVGYAGTNIIGSQKRLIDPACGSGSFLVTAARRLVAAYQGTREQVDDPVAVLTRVQQSLFGFDLNPFACYLAEMNVLIQVLDLVKQALAVNKDLRLKPFHIYNVDALTRPNDIYYYINFHTLPAEENDEVNRIKTRSADGPYAQGFAFVVANPPYGATLSDTYKKMLRENWSDVFYGQPDTYTFFLKLGLELLAKNGKLGFILPNTYLMGKNTALLRDRLLNTTRVEQIVDLPQGVWKDANVDCVLLFLAAEDDDRRRLAQQVQINILGLRDPLAKLRTGDWSETLIQSQSQWLTNKKHEIIMRQDILLRQIEQACLVEIQLNGGSTTKVQQLQDLTESTQGIIPYVTRESGEANTYIRSEREVPATEADWKPLLDGNSFIGRYELRWATQHPFLKYGRWLGRPRESKFFESPKLLVQDMRNRALKRRLVATFDDHKFYNRHNFSNIIAKNPAYDLKYILALFNSSLLNYWLARQFDNLHINPSYFRQLPIYPADLATQRIFVALVDDMLAKHTELNTLRAQGYLIKVHPKSGLQVEVPYDILLRELRAAQHDFPVLILYDAKALDLFIFPERCDLSVTVSSNVYVSAKYPASIVLRHNKLWLDVPDEHLHKYLLNYLQRPQWQGKTWGEIKNIALIPEGSEALQVLFALEQQKLERISTVLNEIRQIDAEIDNRVLDLYSVTDPSDRQRILGSAPIEEEEEAAAQQSASLDQNEI
jgi:type I restriction enzyme M protein